MGTLLHEGSEFLHETNERPECMKNTNHKYLCWLAGIKGIGRVKKYALLRAAGEASLFSMLEESRLFSMEEEAGTLSTEEAGHFSLEAAENGRDPGLAARIIYTSSEKELRFSGSIIKGACPSKRNLLLPSSEPGLPPDTEGNRPAVLAGESEPGG